jgi:hypothetical protein
MHLATRNPRSARTWALLLAAGCLLAALVAAVAPRDADSAPLPVLTLGQTAETPKPSCPGKIVNGQEIMPCRVEGHVTGFQTEAEGVANPYEAPYDGKIVAWSLSLSKPSSKKTKTTEDQIGFFNEILGSPSQARISILRPTEKGTDKQPKYKLVRQSPVVTLNPYFGTSPTFALEQPLVVLKGQIVALSVPTWAPMFAVEVKADNVWRASRAKSHCESKEDIEKGKPQQAIGTEKGYGCVYSNARLLYTATLVKKP